MEPNSLSVCPAVLSRVSHKPEKDLNYGHAPKDYGFNWSRFLAQGGVAHTPAECLEALRKRLVPYHFDIFGELCVDLTNCLIPPATRCSIAMHMSQGNFKPEE